jgi:multisubunit Na+/H+ antiporter MnhF subunit
VESQQDTKNRGLVAILVLAAVFFIMLLAFAFFAMRAVSGSKSQDFVLGSDANSGAIAVIEIEGAIMSVGFWRRYGKV